MKDTIFEIENNRQLTSSVYEMILRGDTSEIKRPGEFVNIRLEGMYLRRPISVCDKQGDMLKLIYKVVGKGTGMMSKMRPGETLDILTGLGNGYDTSKCEQTALLIGGGVGVPPMYMLAKELLTGEKHVKVILGFNTKEEIFYEDEFRKLGCEVFVTTADGSYGHKGFVTDCLDQIGTYDHFYTCGPQPMLKAVFKFCTTSGQFSFEERMGCGFGACMGCSCKTITGYKRICKDGPVLFKEEILWED